MRTKLREYLVKRHEDVARWSMRCLRNGHGFTLVDAREPVKYCCSGDKFWKQFVGNRKHYPLVDNHIDQEYFHALKDLSRIKLA